MQGERLCVVTEVPAARRGRSDEAQPAHISAQKGCQVGCLISWHLIGAVRSIVTKQSSYLHQRSDDGKVSSLSSVYCSFMHRDTPQQAGLVLSCAPGPDFWTDSGRRSKSSSHSWHHCVTHLHLEMHQSGRKPAQKPDLWDFEASGSVWQGAQDTAVHACRSRGC